MTSSEKLPSRNQDDAPVRDAAASVHPAVKLWRMAAFLDGEEGMDKHQWFARLTQSDPGRRHFGRVCSSFPEYHDKLWAECSPDLKRFHAGQEFIHDTGMWWDEAAPPAEPEPQVGGTLVAVAGPAWVHPSPHGTPSIAITGWVGTVQTGAPLSVHGSDIVTVPELLAVLSAKPGSSYVATIRDVQDVDWEIRQARLAAPRAGTASARDTASEAR